MHPTSWLQIDLGRLDANLHAFQNMLQPTGDGRRPRVCGVVKADAYGLGVAPVARRLRDRGVDFLAVFSEQEARELITEHINIPILMLAPVRELHRDDVLYRPMVDGQLHLTLHDLDQLDQTLAMARTYGFIAPLHVQLDTAMSRGGLNREQFDEALRRVADQRLLRVAGVSTHFASAETDPDLTAEQAAQLDAAIAANADFIPDEAIIHMANTAGTLRDPSLHRDMVRVGLGLFGFGLDRLEGPIPVDLPELKPITRWLTRLFHVQRYPAGRSVGYGQTFTLKRDSLLGVAPVGYADGYPLGLTNKASVMVNGAAAPIIGKVNMDQVMVDLTDVGDASVGDIVEMVGFDRESPNALHRLADAAGSNCYEMLCRLATRVPRQYVDSSVNAPKLDPPALRTGVARTVRRSLVG